MGLLFEALIIISVFLVIYWVLYGEKKQKELLSQSENHENNKGKR